LLDRPGTDLARDVPDDHQSQRRVASPTVEVHPSPVEGCSKVHAVASGCQSFGKLSSSMSMSDGSRGSALSVLFPPALVARPLESPLIGLCVVKRIYGTAFATPGDRLGCTMHKAVVQKGPSRRSRSCELHPQAPRLIKLGGQSVRRSVSGSDRSPRHHNALLRSAPTMDPHVGGSHEG